MWELIGGVIILIIVIVILAAFLFIFIAPFFRGSSSKSLSVELRRNPQYVCSSGSCPIETEWSHEADNLTVESALLQIVRPDGSTSVLSEESSGSTTISPASEHFNETGVYMLEFTASGEGESEVASLPVHFFAEPAFVIKDIWNTGFTGGTLSDNDTVATHSTVLSQNDHVSGISEIDGKWPTTATVCSKGMALRGVTHAGGTIGSGIVRPIEVTVRRLDGTVLAAATLQYEETLSLPGTAVIDDGIEVLSIMRSEKSPPDTIAGSQWELHLNLVCLES